MPRQFTPPEGILSLLRPEPPAPDPLVTPNVTIRELVDCPFMEPLYDGGYLETSEVAHAWRCDSCGLVWDRRKYAEGCARRQHAPHWMRGYGATMVHNGVPNYRGFAPVDAIRREALDTPRLPDDPMLVALKAQREAERAARRAEVEAQLAQERIEDLLLDWELDLWDDLAALQDHPTLVAPPPVPRRAYQEQARRRRSR